MIRSIVILASTVLLGTTVPPTLLRSDAPALEITTSVAPVTQDEFQLLKRRVKPGMYRCSVRIQDEPGSHRVWGTNHLVLAPGETDEVTDTLGNLKLHFRAKLGKDLDYASTTVTVYRDEKVINRQTSTFALQRPPFNRQFGR